MARKDPEVIFENHDGTPASPEQLQHWREQLAREIAALKWGVPVENVKIRRTSGNQAS